MRFASQSMAKSEHLNLVAGPRVKVIQGKMGISGNSRDLFT